MSLLPRVTTASCEKVAMDFDSRGPDACVTEIVEHLRQHNPEILDMARKCAADSHNSARLMTGLGMFYRLLVGRETADPALLTPLPRVTAETRDRLVAEIDQKGADAFILDAIAELETSNPELLQMAHGFASAFPDYLHAMQGFALLYRSLLVQSNLERNRLH